METFIFDVSEYLFPIWNEFSKIGNLKGVGKYIMMILSKL